MRVIFVVLSLLLMFPPSPALAAPDQTNTYYQVMWKGDIKLDLIKSLNPKYVWNTTHGGYVLTPQDIAQIKSVAPDTKIILYRHSADMFNPKKLDQSLPALEGLLNMNTQSEIDDLLKNHQDAFLRNEKGRYVGLAKGIGGDPQVLDETFWMLPTNRYYQEFLFNRVKYHLTTQKFDGVYFDLMYPVAPGSYMDSDPVVKATKPPYRGWQDWMIDLSQYLHRQLANDPALKNKILITNSVGEDPSYFFAAEGLAFNRDLGTKAIQIENYFDRYPPMLEGWSSQVQAISQLTSLNNRSMGGWFNYHPATNFPNKESCDKMATFSYSSFLLANNSPDFAYSFLCKVGSGNDRYFPSHWLTKISLGKPNQAINTPPSGLYTRSFVNGLVIVNPTAKAANYKPTLNLSDAYSGKEYPKNQNIAVPAYTGMVLLSDTAPAPGDPADLNGDGVVNLFDYSHLLANFGNPYTIFDYTRLLIALRK